MIHSRGATQLLDAITDGESELALRLIRDGADPNQAGDTNCPPLYMAAGDPKMLRVVKALVEKGATVEGAGPLGTPLTAACYTGSPEIVDYLISKGADISVRCGPHGYEPLHAAIAAATDVPPKGLFGRGRQIHPGRELIVALLVRNGADINALTAEGRTPLDLAFEVRRGDITNILDHHGGKTSKFIASTKPTTSTKPSD